MRWNTEAQGLLCLPATEKISIIQVYEDEVVTADNQRSSQEPDTSELSQDCVSPRSQKRERESAASSPDLSSSGTDSLSQSYEQALRARRLKRKRPLLKRDDDLSYKMKPRRAVKVKRRRLASPENSDRHGQVPVIKESRPPAAQALLKVKQEKENEQWIPIGSFRLLEDEESELSATPHSQMDLVSTPVLHKLEPNDHDNHDSLLQQTSSQQPVRIIEQAENPPLQPSGPPVPCGAENRVKVITCHGSMQSPTAPCQLFFHCWCGKHVMCSICNPSNPSCDELLRKDDDISAPASQEPSQEPSPEESQITLENLLFVAHAGEQPLRKESEDEYDANEGTLLIFYCLRLSHFSRCLCP